MTLPWARSNAVGDAARNLGLGGENELLSATQFFFHACTVADNTLITRAGPRTGLLTTQGFGDTLLIMRGRTTEGLTESDAFRASTQSKPDPIVPRSLIEEVGERIDYKGSVLIHLEAEEIARSVRSLIGRGAESIAIALLWSLTNDAHERALADFIKKNYPSIYLSLSSEVAPFLGEYERTATTVFNAYVGPKIAAYLRGLGELLRSKGLVREPLVMQAYGGVLGINDTCKNAVGMIESGPASGIIGSRFIGAELGVSDVLATDMGGTTFKVGVIRDGAVEMDHKPIFMRYQLFLSKIWVESIGAGGGSIVWIDPETGLLKVGPQGAGVEPRADMLRHGRQRSDRLRCGSDPWLSQRRLFSGRPNEVDKSAGARSLKRKNRPTHEYDRRGGGERHLPDYQLAHERSDPPAQQSSEATIRGNSHYLPLAAPRRSTQADTPRSWASKKW